MVYLRLPIALAMIALSASVFAQSAKDSIPSSAELAACKATALSALSQKDAAITDIIIDEDGLTIATADTKVEDTPIKRIIMGEAYLHTLRQDKPRRFLCLVGEKGKVLLTFFTQN